MKQINKPTCKCGAQGIQNFNMIISLISEQPLEYYNELPQTLNLQPETSRIGTWVIWDSPTFAIVCRQCGKTNYPNLKRESIFRQIKLRIKNYFVLRAMAGQNLKGV